jgi:hypothetical protein
MRKRRRRTQRSGSLLGRSSLHSLLEMLAAFERSAPSADGEVVTRWLVGMVKGAWERGLVGDVV